jgi:hypothetical protein
MNGSVENGSSITGRKCSSLCRPLRATAFTIWTHGQGTLCFLICGKLMAKPTGRVCSIDELFAAVLSQATRESADSLGTASLAQP